MQNIYQYNIYQHITIYQNMQICHHVAKLALLNLLYPISFSYKCSFCRINNKQVQQTEGK